MWIKKPSLQFEASEKDESLNDKLNFLFKSDNIYVMDNHLAAGWAWLQNIDIHKSYNFFHIDQHYDLIDNTSSIQEVIIEKGILLNKLTLNQYLELRQPSITDQYIALDQQTKLFRWDNYIANINDVYPALFKLRYFATHKGDDHKLENFIDEEIDSFNLNNSIKKNIGKEDGDKWILNLDIDYFFSNDYPITQNFSDTYIINLITEIKNNLSNIEVFTICLSPECCGGWIPAIDKAKLICNILDIEFDIK